MADIPNFVKKLIRRIYWSESQILKDLKDGDQYDLGKIWQDDSIADIQKLDELLLILLAILRKEKIALNRLTVGEILRHLCRLTENEESLMQRGAQAQVQAISSLGPKLWLFYFRNEMAHLNAELSEVIRRVDREDSQLIRVLNILKKNKKIYDAVLKIISERNPDKFKWPREVQNYIESAVSRSDALGVAKLIDYTLGPGTFRTLSFLDAQRDSARSVYKLISHNITSTSFEKGVERGYYLNLLENYGVQWDLEKVARDILQNFFDANGQTLDGIKIDIKVKEQEQGV